MLRTGRQQTRAMVDVSATFIDQRTQSRLGHMTMPGAQEPRERAQRGFEVGPPPLQLAAESSRIEIETGELPLIVGPQPFVVFDAVEHVELARPFFECGADGEGHQHETKAERAVTLGEAVLIEEEAPVVTEGVHRASEVIVQIERIEPQTVRIERAFGGLTVEVLKLLRTKRG